MSANNQPKSRRSQAAEKKEVKKLPELLTYWLIFCMTYPPLILFGYVTGFMDSALNGGKAAIESGSFSVVADVVFLTVAILVFVLGPLSQIFAQKYMED